MIRQGYHDSGKLITVVREFTKYVKKKKAVKLDMTIKNSNEDGQTLYVKRYMTERWFSRIVGPLGRSYVKVALKLKVKLTCWKDRARNQSDCGTKPF